MKSRDLSFLVLGAGAVGGITAALMKKNGYDVEIICKYDEYASLISNHGLNVKGYCGSFSVKIPAYSSAKILDNKKDVILHATKATDMADAALESAFLLKENGCFVSMQNGIVEDKLMAVAENKRVVGCVTGWGATMESQGNLIMTSAGDFILGYPDRPPDESLSLVAEALSSVVPVKITDNIMGHLYSKLIINSCITSLGAICGLYLGEMLSMAKIRRIFIEIIRESMAVADRMKIHVEVFGGRLDFKKFIEGAGSVSDLRRHLMIRLIGFKYRRLKSSSLQSLERGRPTEIDYLNGYIVRNAEKHNIEAPVNKAIVRIIHEIEAKKRVISAENFNDPAFDRFN
ncbi:MAG: ketopantoate reductase family protein [Bacteroidales bacterium]|nr:ketopantoate reductase family protein [Bacteroidales bacterium]